MPRARGSTASRSSFGGNGRIGRRLAALPEAFALLSCFAARGNNGGDGYVAAAALAETGASVAVFALGTRRF